jgi:monoamine oxidase
MEKFDVVIVGGGMAGLSAAYELKKRGLTYIVLEAQDRVGGRMHSEKLRNGLVVELGAEWISRTDKELLDLCNELSIKLENHTYTHSRFIDKNGKESETFADLMKRVDTFIHKNKKKHLRDSVSWYTFLKKNFTEDEMRKLEIMYSPEFAEHIRYFSAKLALEDLLEGGKNDHMDFHVRGGNSKIIDTLARAVGKKNIRLQEPVVKIIDTHNEVKVLTKNGHTYTGKKLLVTAAAQAFKHIEVVPKLPEHKKLARELKYGDITKLFISFKTPLPVQKQHFSMFTNGPCQYVYVCTQGQSKNKFALCIYSVKERAKRIARMSEDEVWQHLKHILPRDTFNVESMVPDQVIRKHWGNDRYVHGAYAVFQPHEYKRVTETFLKKKTGNIFFAGEYLGEMFGYMNGARQSAITAIQRMRL